MDDWNYGSMFGHEPNTDERIIHDPDQIMTAEELEVGKRYREMNSVYGAMRTFTIISLPYTNERGFLVIDTEEGGSITNYLCDLGVVAYPDGKWNSRNYLMREDKVK